MSYVAWAVLYEGETDASYFDVLIPRLMEAIVLSGPRLPTIPLTPSVRFRRAGPDAVAAEACEAIEAYELIFIHADTGGRGLEQGLDHRGQAYCRRIHELCGFPPERCILIAPRHETEAWVLADPRAVIESLGYNGNPAAVGLPLTPAAAERLQNPKAILEQAASLVRGRRRPVQASQIFPAVAQRQDLALLRGIASFRAFEQRVESALVSIRAI